MAHYIHATRRQQNITATRKRQIPSARAVGLRFCLLSGCSDCGDGDDPDTGSAQLKGTAGTDSDIDLLVEFDPATIPGLMGIAGIEIELSELLGQKVDLRTAADLSGYFRDEILQIAQVQYVA